jgi:hypothetical protein
VAGVVAERVAAGSSGLVVVQGIWPVRVTGAVAIGDLLVQSAAAGRAQAPVQAEDGAVAIGRALDANAGGDGVVAARLGREVRGAFKQVVETSGTAYSTSASSFVDVGGNMVITLRTTGRPVLVWFNGWFYQTYANTTRLRYTVDGTPVGGSTGRLVGVLAGDGTQMDFAVPCEVDAGEHTFRLQWYQSTGSIQLLRSADYPLFFGAAELL